MTWDSITLGEFIQIRDAAKIEDRIAREIQLLVILENLTVEEIEKITIDEINKRVGKYTFLHIEPIPNDKMPAFKSGKHWFMPIPLVDQMPTKKYLDYKALLKSVESEDGVDEEKLMQNYHRLIACFLKCDSLEYDNETYATHALTMPIQTALAMAGFFFRLWKGLLETLEAGQLGQVVPKTST